MANLSHLFNVGFMPEEIEDQDSEFEPLPKGHYPVIISNSELKDNKNLTGINMTLKYNVTGGKYQNRILFENLCVQHQNATAQSIAQTKLKRICEALNITKLVDTSELHDKPLIIAVDIEVDDYATERNVMQGDGKPVFRNVIRGYMNDPQATPVTKAKPTPKQRAMADSGPLDDGFNQDIPF